MKPYYLISLLFLSACSSTPKLTLHPQQPPATEGSGIRYPEVLHAYHVGRYADPNDDLIMHEQHVVYRVEENTRWDFHPGPANGGLPALPPRDAAFAPAPVNDDILAEVNSQRLATTEIMMQSRTLSAALAQFQAALSQTKTNFQETVSLHASVNEMQKRLDALAAAQLPTQVPGFNTTNTISTTNEPPDSLSP